MMRVLAPVDNIRFDIEDALEKQTYSVMPLPFTGMDKSAASVCELYVKSSCDRGIVCPFRHVKGDKSVVCKHWLRGLCKKGDDCEFLHEYDMSKMPECFFYSKYNQCGNKECEYLHLDRESKIKDCPWYDRGFCRHGPNCKNRHLKKLICQNYLFGFCPEGPGCKSKHPKFELPVADTNLLQKKQVFVCDHCGEKGHKVSSCFKLNPEHRQAYQLKRELANQELNILTGMVDHHHGQRFDDHGMKQGENADKNISRENHHNGPMFGNQNESGNAPHPTFQHQHRNPHHNPNFMNQHHNFSNERYQPLPPSEVTCFKCGEKGHYANKCNKGVFAFLRSSMDHSNAMNDSDK